MSWVSLSDSLIFATLSPNTWVDEGGRAAILEAAEFDLVFSRWEMTNFLLFWRVSVKPAPATRTAWLIFLETVPRKSSLI
jgi:hypothetical protein